MKTLYLALALFLSLLAAAKPIPDATADPHPDPVAIEFYGASLTGTPQKKREVVVRDDTIIPDMLLVKPKLMKRTQSPTSGEHANKCSAMNQGGGVSYTCGVGNAGLCCSINGWCGATSWYCGGGCQSTYGSCVTPYLQLTYDADAGDSIWDIISDNVFDAAVGDGLIYYGATPAGGWPS